MNHFSLYILFKPINIFIFMMNYFANWITIYSLQMNRDGLSMHILYIHVIRAFSDSEKEGWWLMEWNADLAWKVCPFRFSDRQGWIEAEHVAGSDFVRCDPQIKLSWINRSKKQINTRASLIHFR